jgi:hypothetical protein
MTPLATTTISTAITQLGVKEIPKGSNAGPEVEIYLKSVGLGKGYAWCMAFVYWVVNQAAIKTAIKNPLKKTAGVLDQYNSRPLLVNKVPQPGDIFIMDFGKGTGHTGIVERVVGTKIHTIEGNTNDEGSREGYEVCRRKREIKTIRGFIRI